MKDKYYFDTFPILENERLLLRAIEDEEAEHMMDLAVYDGFFPKTTEDVICILNKIRQDYQNGDSVSWGIYLKSTEQILGTCCYCRGYQDNIGEIGYVIKEKFRNKHIMTEAGKLLVDFGLTTMNLSKITAFTHISNTASQALLLRLGFKLVPNMGEDLKFEILNQNLNS